MADINGVQGALQTFDVAAFDVTWQVDDNLGGSTLAVQPVRLVATPVAGAALNEVPSTAAQHPQAGMQHWYADPNDEPAVGGGAGCEDCGGLRGVMAHNGVGGSGTVVQVHFVLTPDGRLLGWGAAGTTGRRGTGQSSADPLTFSYVCPPGPPTPCPGEALEDVVSVTAGEGHACALTGAGNVLCWGNGNRGLLGTGNQTQQFRPAWVCADDSNPDCAANPLSGVAAISAGQYHTCALLQSGGIKCWGRNDANALGGGASGDALYPIDVCESGTAPDCTTGTAFTGATAITAGGRYTCATTDAGEVKCWGLANKLGRGSSPNEPYPVNVCGVAGCGGDLTGVVSLSAGDGHTCAVLDTTEVVCWGDGAGGSLGNGGTVSSLLPTPVCDGAAGCALGSGALANVLTVSAGTNGACALLNTGEARCWGQNNVGQCGDGTNVQRLLPTPVCVSGSVGIDCVPLTGAVAVHRSSQSQCAITQGGELHCWGILYDENENGSPLTAVPLCTTGFGAGCVDRTDVAVRTCAEFSAVEIP